MAKNCFEKSDILRSENRDLATPCPCIEDAGQVNKDAIASIA
jgi:hypothetical protein